MEKLIILFFLVAGQQPHVLNYSPQSILDCNNTAISLLNTYESAACVKEITLADGSKDYVRDVHRGSVEYVKYGHPVDMSLGQPDLVIEYRGEAAPKPIN